MNPLSFPLNAIVCRGVCEMRVTAEAAQRFLDQERGMRDALTSALQ